MKNLISLFLFCMLTAAQSTAQKKLSAEEIITSLLKTTDGKIFRMYETRKFTASVFVFMLPDCPACENYSGTLNAMSDKFKSKGIQFYGVFPAFIEAHEIDNFVNTYHIRFPVLMDYNHELLKAFDAHVAPSAYVISETTLLLYRGRIDDWMYAVGKKRTVITHHELEDALNAIAEHKPVKVDQTQPVGCLID
jgi:peroxiredoxin